MRTNRLNAVAAAAFTTALLLSGCWDGDSEQAVVTPPVVQELQNARYQVSFVDAVSGAPITDALNVSFVGAAQLKAADGSSLNDKTVATSSGTVFVSADFTSTANNFSVQVADAGNKGWVPTGTRVVGTADIKGDQSIEVRMVNTAAAAAVNASTAPVAMVVTTGAASATGALTAPVALATAPKTVTNAEGQPETIGTAALAISAGTIGKTSSGAPAAAGPLTVSNTYYSNANVESMTAFPGGFAANVEVPAANTAVLNGAAPDAGTFVTAGFAQFNVTDSQGNAIKTFDKPLTVGIDLPRNTLDVNGNALAVGSQYPVWSYDDATGKWVFEKMGTVAEKTPVDPNNFTVQFQTNHLSSWNLDQYVNSCTATINLQGRPAGDTRVLNVEVVGGTGLRYSYAFPVTDSQLTLFRTPRINATITVKDRGVVVGKLSDRALCSGAVGVPVVLAPLQQGSVRIETLESCADGSNQRAIAASSVLRYTAAGRVTSRAVYTRQLASGDNLAQASVASLPSGAVTVQAQNPRTRAWVEPTSITGGATTSVVVTGGTTVFRFRFPMTCQNVTGGF